MQLNLQRNNKKRISFKWVWWCFLSYIYFLEHMTPVLGVFLKASLEAHLIHQRFPNISPFMESTLKRVQHYHSNRKWVSRMIVKLKTFFSSKMGAFFWWKGEEMSGGGLLYVFQCLHWRTLGCIFPLFPILYSQPFLPLDSDCHCNYLPSFFSRSLPIKSPRCQARACINTHIYPSFSSVLGNWIFLLTCYDVYLWAHSVIFLKSCKWNHLWFP